MATPKAQNDTSIITPDLFSKLIDDIKSYTADTGLGQFHEETKQDSIRVLTLAHSFWRFKQNMANDAPPDKVQDNEVVLKGLRDMHKRWYKEFSDLVEKFNGIMKVVSSGQKMLASALKILEKKQESLMDLESTHETRRYNFGKDMKVLMQLIEANKDKFIQMPKGPLGSCISARDKTWVKLLETILAPYLWLFMADNQQDSELLTSMIDKVFGKFAPPHMFKWKRPEVWTTKFDKCHDVKWMDTVTGYFTVSDAIMIHDDDIVVEKTLWEMLPIGHILLFRSRHDAFSEVSESYYTGTFAECMLPDNYVAGYTLDYYHIHPYPDFKSLKIRPKHNGLLSHSADNATLRFFEDEIKRKESSTNGIKIGLITEKHKMIKTSEVIHLYKKILYACDILMQMIQRQPQPEKTETASIKKQVEEQ